MILFTQEAEADLMAIADYIAADNVPRAHSFVQELRVHCQGIADFPLSRPLVPQIGPDVRQSVFGNYNIYYVVNADHTKGAVIVFGIIQGHRSHRVALSKRTL